MSVDKSVFPNKLLSANRAAKLERHVFASVYCTGITMCTVIASRSIFYLGMALPLKFILRKASSYCGSSTYVISHSTTSSTVQLYTKRKIYNSFTHSTATTWRVTRLSSECLGACGFILVCGHLQKNRGRERSADLELIMKQSKAQWCVAADCLDRGSWSQSAEQDSWSCVSAGSIAYGPSRAKKVKR